MQQSHDDDKAEQILFLSLSLFRVLNVSADIIARGKDDDD